jgi:hypothetical protein
LKLGRGAIDPEVHTHGNEIDKKVPWSLD